MGEMDGKGSMFLHLHLLAAGTIQSMQGNFHQLCSWFVSAFQPLVLGVVTKLMEL